MGLGVSWAGRTAIGESIVTIGQDAFAFYAAECGGTLVLIEFARCDQGRPSGITS